MGEGAAAQKLDEMRKAGQHIDEEVVNLPPEVFGRPKAPAGTWASGIRIIDPVEVSLASLACLLLVTSF